VIKEDLTPILNPLLGDNGAARVYAPQKGATPSMVEALERGMRNFADVVENQTSRSVRDLAGVGAAGGFAAGIIACFRDATITSGVDLRLDEIGFDSIVMDADLVITGEGRIDHLTFNGKCPLGIACRAQRYHVPVLAIVGSVGFPTKEMWQKIGANFAVIDVSEGGLPDVTSGRFMADTAVVRIRMAASQVGRILASGQIQGLRALNSPWRPGARCGAQTTQ